MSRSVEYYQYLASPQWQAKRAHIFAGRLRRCERCHAFGCRLDVHHKTYANFGCERDEDLEILCRPCHDSEHTARGSRHSNSMAVLAMAEAQRWRR